MEFVWCNYCVCNGELLWRAYRSPTERNGSSGVCVRRFDRWSRSEQSCGNIDQMQFPALRKRSQWSHRQIQQRKDSSGLHRYSRISMCLCILVLLSIHLIFLLYLYCYTQLNVKIIYLFLILFFSFSLILEDAYYFNSQL